MENLRSAIAGEHMEWAELHSRLAEAAEKESLVEEARTLRAIAEAERHHEERL